MKLYTIISFVTSDLTEIEAFVKLECVNNRITLQTANEILRLTRELQDKILNVTGESSKQSSKQ